MYADELDIIYQKDEKPEIIVEKMQNVLAKNNLIVNEPMTEIYVYSNVKPEVQKLGTLRYESAEINERKQLVGIAL